MKNILNHSMITKYQIMFIDFINYKFTKFFTSRVSINYNLNI